MVVNDQRWLVAVWPTDRFRRCSRHAWLHESDYIINERIEYKLLSLTYKVLTTANLTTYTILSLFSLQVELSPRLLSP